MKREYWRYLPAVFPYLGRHKLLFISSVILTILGSVVALLDPWPLAFLVDSALGKHAPPQVIARYAGTDHIHLILVAVVAGFAITFLIQGVSVLTEYVNTRIDLSVSLDVRSDLFAHCQRLSQAFHERITTGDMMYRINFEATQYGSMSVALLPLAQSTLTLVGMLFVAMKIDRTVALLSLVVVPLLYYSVGFYGKRIEPRMIRVRNLESQTLTMVNTAMAMLRVITAFNRQGYEHHRFRRQGVTAVKARVRLTVYQMLFSMVVALATASGVGLVLYIGATHVLEGKLTVGELIVFLSYIHSMYTPLQTISSTVASFQQKLISIRFARRLFETKPEVDDMPGAVQLERSAGRVTFENVDYDYPRRTGTLRGISFDVQPGEVVAVVGVTGAGKSTLVSLIPRFMDASAGRVLIDGTDVREATLHSVRDQVGFVQQEPLLFSETIRENIRYGRLDATDEEVVEAARQANAHDFISALPEGYDTPLGERGARISGGERQRITIARAFLKNAPILVLDEPTSSIDSRTEAVILDALDRLMEGRTTFIVAHRLSTLRRAERVLVLDGGHLVETGTPEELLRKGGTFAELHALQSGRPAAAVSRNGEVSADLTGRSAKKLGAPATPSVAPAVAGRPKLVVLGMMSKMPVAGVVWQTVHYLLGFARQGYDVYYVESHARTPSMLMHSDREDSSALAAGFIRDVMHRFDLDGRWCFHALHADGSYHGMSESQVKALYRDAALIVNLHGGTQPRPEHAATGRLVYLETDPVQLQVELHDGRPETLEFLEPHSAFFTFGENWGRPDCRLPVDHRFPFHPTRQPVVLDLWHGGRDTPLAPFTTVANWRQQWRDVTLDGQVYGWSKDQEFRRFLELPTRTGEIFELALASCGDEDRAELESRCWRVRDAEELSWDLDLYRDYIRTSRGEFTAAKEQNVRLRSGWFSDRSATYLAAGRPVITQDTGFGATLPTGAGLFPFSTLEEAAEAVGRISTDWTAESRAAREIAEEFFSDRIVLGRLLADCGLGPAGAGTATAVSARHPGTVSEWRHGLPRDMVIEPVSRQPVTLEPATVKAVMARPLPVAMNGSARHNTTPRASIVVVSYDNLLFTRLCMETLLANTEGPAYEVIAVDNGSTDGSVDYLQALAASDHRVRVLANPSNLGFAAAVNAGLAEARGDVLVVLNNDVLLAPGWLSGLCARLDDWTVGLVGPLTNRAPGETRVAVRHRTFGEFLDHATAVRAGGGHREVAMLPMICVALRRAVYDEIGALDGRFGIGMFEDDDYCVRLRAAGYRLVCAEDVFIHHFGGATFGRLVSSGEFQSVFDANRRLFEDKWGVTWSQPEGREDAAYAAMRASVRLLVRGHVPPGELVAVLSRGDEALLDLPGLRAEHFPQEIDGRFAGWYPKDTGEAIGQLERLRARGCRHLVIPATSAWWLDYYRDLDGYLRAEWGYPLTVRDVCSIFGPGGRAPAGSNGDHAAVAVESDSA